MRAALLRLSRNTALDDAYLQAQSEDALLAVRTSGSKRKIVLDRSRLTALAPALQRRVLRLALVQLREASHDIEDGHIASFLDAALDPKTNFFSITIPAPMCHLILETDRILVRLANTPRTAVGATPLTVSGPTLFGETGWTIEAQFMPERDTSDNAETLDADVVDLPTLHVRGWRAGDRMDVLGLGGKTKKLSDLFTDAKIPRDQRSTVPIIADANGPLWIVGMRIAERAKTTETTTRFLRLTAALTPRPPLPILGEGESEFLG